MTPHELRCFDFVRDTIASAGVSPTYAQIAAHLGYRGKASVARLVDGLVRQGMLERRPFHRNGLRVAGQPSLASVSTAALRAELARRDALTQVHA